MKHSIDPKNPPRKFTQAEVNFVKSALRKLDVRDPDLDDTTQDVLCDVSAHLPEHDPSRPLNPWLSGFARIGAWAYRRQRSRRASREVLVSNADELEVPVGGPGPHEHAVARKRLAMLDAMLAELPRKEAEVLLLYEGTSMEVTEVATALAVPTGTAASRLHQARQNLHAARTRLEARLAHRGETWGVVPPLALLFATSEASHGDTGEPPSAPGVSPAVPPRAPRVRWFIAAIPAGLGAIAATALVGGQFAQCDSEPAHPVAHATIVPESTPEPAPSAAPAPVLGAAPPPVVSAALPRIATAPPRDDLTADEVKAEANAARTSLGRGDALAALGTLERLDKRDRRGLLWAYRESIRIEVLARLGRLPEARARLAGLRKTRPEDPLLERLDSVLSASP